MKKVLLVAFAVAVSFSLATIASAKEAKMTSTTIKGWVSDSKCGVKGNNAAHAACTAKCLANGEKPVLVEGDKVMMIDNPEAVKGHEGHYVKVKGHVDGDKVHIMTVSMLKQPKDKNADSMSDMHK